MDKIIYTVLLAFLVHTEIRSQKNVPDIVQPSVIPQPVSLAINQGHFRINSETTLYMSPNMDKQNREFIQETLRKSTDKVLPITISENKKNSIIKLIINKNEEQNLGTEGYRMDVSTTAIVIRANTPNGIFYGIQTLIQSLPSRRNSSQSLIKNDLVVPCLQVIDYPRFEWRGVMLDVSRHFFTTSEIKSLIDEIAKYKFNKFHWHLTDDQGWRIEIKGLPNLTNVGAWRVPRVGGDFGEYPNPLPGEKATYGGYYTQDEIRDIIKYANAKFVSIVPEIDVPGHSMALIASYPNLSCHQKPSFVNPGSMLTEDDENVLCVSNDSTYIVLDSIFSQIASLFPSRFIHLGGDEVYKGFWANCSKDIAFMNANHLSTKELQSYFIKKVANIINNKHKEVIGWGEILEGGLTPGAIVMSWKSMEAGIEAAKIGHKVIMTPWNDGLYMDNSPIKRSYSFDPVPDGINKEFILGGEGCLWTERVPNEAALQVNFWPRLMAVSEVFWTPNDKKNWNYFEARMENHLSDFDNEAIKFSKSIFDPIITPFENYYFQTLSFKISSQLQGIDTYYSFDGYEPYPSESLRYKGGLLKLPKGATEIKAVNYRNGSKIGEVVTFSIKNPPNLSRHDKKEIIYF